MRTMKWITLALLGLLAAGGFNSLLAVSEQRQAYDKMVEEATQEADEYLQEKETARKAAAAEAQSKQDASLNEKIQAESQRIQAEMDTVRQRGMGSGWTQGMRDNQLKQLQEKLDQLNSDPEAYFQNQ
jgi:rhamnose utilization protein RhaD (predicted bifunctional aldolase and dehydrogenase)